MLLAFSVNYSDCSTGQTRLSDSSFGRIEICYNNVWYGLCPDYYNNIPTIVCGALGFSQGIIFLIMPNTAIAIGIGYSSNFLNLRDLPLIPFEFYCSGNEQSLLDCSRSTYGCYSSYYYSYNDYTGVTCQGNQH